MDWLPDWLQLDKHLLDLDTTTEQVISTWDVVFNEEERFTGDLEKLKDNVQEVNLEELAKLL